MTASVIRPKSSTWTRFASSRDALDMASDVLDQAAEIKCAGEILHVYPGDREQLAKARAAARIVLSLCDDIEQLVRLS